MTTHNAAGAAAAVGYVFAMIPSGLPSPILNLYWTKWTMSFVCFSFFFSG